MHYALMRVLLKIGFVNTPGARRPPSLSRLSGSGGVGRKSYVTIETVFEKEYSDAIEAGRIREEAAPDS